VTKGVARTRRKLRLTAALLAVWIPAFGQETAHPASPPQVQLGGTPVLHSAAENLFLQLGSVGLDSSQVYRARELSIDRADFHISFDDGVIGFTQDVAGCVTGAFFEGEGEILLTPPSQVERASMLLQTGAAILEERFKNAYFRFNDDTFAEMQPYLVPAEGSAEFVSQWNQTARNLALPDGLRLFMTFSQQLPANGVPAKPAKSCGGPDDRFLHARMQGQTKGIFDVFYDSGAPEQVWAAQSKAVEGTTYYNVWTSYSLLKKKSGTAGANSIATEEGRVSAIDILSNKIRVEIRPPTTIDAVAELDLKVLQGGQRAVVFELARLLHLKEVLADGHPVEFIHNPPSKVRNLPGRVMTWWQSFFLPRFRPDNGSSCASATAVKSCRKLPRDCFTWAHGALGTPTAASLCPTLISNSTTRRVGRWWRLADGSMCPPPQAPPWRIPPRPPSR